MPLGHLPGPWGGAQPCWPNQHTLAGSRPLPGPARCLVSGYCHPDLETGFEQLLAQGSSKEGPPRPAAVPGLRDLWFPPIRSLMEGPEVGRCAEGLGKRRGLGRLGSVQGQVLNPGDGLGWLRAGRGKQ